MEPRTRQNDNPTINNPNGSNNNNSIDTILPDDSQMKKMSTEALIYLLVILQMETLKIEKYLNTKMFQWKSHIQYVDLETGEQLTQNDIDTKKYLKIKYTKETKQNGQQHITIYTWGCRRNTQQRLF